MATCEAIGLPRSTYYYQSRRPAASIAFENAILLRLFDLSHSYPKIGYRMMTRFLQKEGLRVNPKRILRLMRLHGLCSCRATTPNAWGARVTHLLRSSRITNADQAWIADTTYVDARCGLVFAATIIDVASRTVAAYAVSNQFSTRIASLALHTAARSHHPPAGCIHHSPCGSHYKIRGYLNLLRRYGLVPSAAASPERDLRHRLVKIDAYDSWADIVACAQTFIRDIYTKPRIDQLLEQCRAPGPCVVTLSAPFQMSSQRAKRLVEPARRPESFIAP